MTKSKALRRVMRALVTLLGAGIGVAVMLGVFQLWRMAKPDDEVPLQVLAVGYTGLGLLGGALFFAFSNRLIDLFAGWGVRMERWLDGMNMGQLSSSMAGLVTGLIIAALISQVLHFMGSSIFTTAFSALLYVALGTVGYRTGRRRADEFYEMLGSRFHRSASASRRYRQGKKSAAKAAVKASRPKLLDSSVLIDGRVAEVARCGFLEGELVIPAFILDELRHIADSPDAARRARGRRGLDMVGELQQLPRITVRVDENDYPDVQEADVKLLRRAQELGGAVVTGDYNLAKVALVASIPVMNLNELASALRPAVHAGDELQVQIVREGREPGQGVGYMQDGTMIVVDGAKQLIGREVAVVVSSALQTNAGRMVFAKVKAA